MASLQQFEKTLVRFIAAPPFLAVEALRDAFAELCRKGYCWQKTNQIETQAGTDRYKLIPAFDSKVNSIVAAALDGKPLVQGQDFELDAGYIRVFNPRAGQLRVVLSLYPMEEATEVDDELYERFRVVICKGAAAELGQDEKNEWALSKAQVAEYKTEFKAGCAEALQWSLNRANRIYEAQTRHQFY